MARPGADIQLVGDKQAAREIAARREGFNSALTIRDMEAIAALLHEDVVLVPGDEAPLIQGRQAQLDAWQQIFDGMDQVTYKRAPARIDVSEDGQLASEQGRWTGGWTQDGFKIGYVGRYFAKWRFDGLNWLIEAETFVTMKRTGQQV